MHGFDPCRAPLFFVSAVSVMVLYWMQGRGGCLDFWCKSLFAISVEIEIPEALFVLSAIAKRPSDGKKMPYHVPIVPYRGAIDA